DQTGFVAQGGTVSENCGGPVTVSSSDSISGLTCANRYTITRTYTVKDSCNNASTCTQIITVNDTTAPNITCPGPVTVSCASSVPAAATDYASFVAAGGSASDNCAANPTITFMGDV